jgi:heptaprenyl diphosphate synthase
MNTQKMVRLSLLVALGTVLSILENQLPIARPPWLRLGLANIMTLVALVMYDTKAAVTVACLRSLLAGIFGSLPMLAFSFPAAITSSLIMGILYRIFGKRLSIIGLSVSGAVVHNMTQLLIAFLILKLNSYSILALSPLLLIAGVIAGVITGLIARYMVKIIPDPEK